MRPSQYPGTAATGAGRRGCSFVSRCNRPSARQNAAFIWQDPRQRQGFMRIPGAGGTGGYREAIASRPPGELLTAAGHAGREKRVFRLEPVTGRPGARPAWSATTLTWDRAAPDSPAASAAPPPPASPSASPAPAHPGRAAARQHGSTAATRTPAGCCASTSPQGTGLSTTTPARLQAIAGELNDRPRTLRLPHPGPPAGQPAAAPDPRHQPRPGLAAAPAEGAPSRVSRR